MEFFATAGNIPMHIRDSKKGDKAIILLHGYMETMYIWNELYDNLKNDYRVILIDLPGHGLSCSAPINTMDFIAIAVKGVLDVCGVKKAYIGGHSLGGYAAFSCCKTFPSTFLGLILFNSHPYPEDPDFAVNREREISIIRSGRLMTLAGVSLPKMYFSENLRKCDDKIRETLELCDTHDPEGIIACIKGMVQRPDNSDFMKNPSLPILVVLGDNDGFISMDLIEQMQLEFPKVKIEIIPSCGHNCFIEKPQEALFLVKAFLG